MKDTRTIAQLLDWKSNGVYSDKWLPDGVQPPREIEYNGIMWEYAETEYDDGYTLHNYTVCSFDW